MTLSTSPADRPAAEAALSGLYEEAGFAPPRFHWVPSPFAALHTAPPGLRAATPPAELGFDALPVVVALRARIVDVRLALDPLIRPAGAYAEVRREVGLPVAACATAVHQPGLVDAWETRFRSTGWYGALRGDWAAEADAARRRYGVALPEGSKRFLDLWKAAAASAGQWWPREDVCVVSERPREIHTEPDSPDGQVRLHRADGPAVRYADGWSAHAWHGTTVPEWVVERPSAARIAREHNVEIRRCAIERMGWGAYLDEAGLALVATAPDPGNPGFELRLYDTERRNTRVLLAVNGSVERDGHRRRYGLTVPGHLADPVEAAAWTYGLSGDVYATLSRRT